MRLTHFLLYRFWGYLSLDLFDGCQAEIKEFFMRLPDNLIAPERNCATIRRAPHSGRTPFRGARSGVQRKFNIIKFSLDPGSRSPWANLAGMTNYFIVYQSTGKGLSDGHHPYFTKGGHQRTISHVNNPFFTFAKEGPRRISLSPSSSPRSPQHICSMSKAKLHCQYRMFCSH